MKAFLELKKDKQSYENFNKKVKFILLNQIVSNGLPKLKKNNK